MKSPIRWHNQSISDVEAVVESNLKMGLTKKDVRKRLKKFGRNRITKQKFSSRFRILFRQFASPLVIILLIAGAVTFYLDKKTDTLVILIAVIINASFGFWEENKVSQIFEKLSKRLKTKAFVIRSGRQKKILAEKVVWGDVIFFKTGDKIPADARLIETKNLRVDQSIITGEWLPVGKTTKTLGKGVSLAERDNMVYSGTLVEAGEGKALVTRTGDNTETGKVASFLEKTVKEKTPLQKKLDSSGKFITFSIVGVCLLLFVIGILRNESPLQMFEVSIAVAVGGIPEALPVVVTVAMAIGMERLLKKKGLIRRLSSVETLGSTSVICFDKTKTLTQGKMVLEQLETKDEAKLLKIASLCNEAFIENPQADYPDWRINGSPTDKAMLVGALKKGFSKPEIQQKSKEIFKLRFSSERKYQASVIKEGKEYFIYLTGAAEKILNFSHRQSDWNKKFKKMARQGLRVVAAGYKKIDFPIEDLSQLERNLKDLEFVGLMAFNDPLRKGIKETIRIAKGAGINPVIITGDHQDTTKTILKKIGMQVKRSQILTGSQLDKLDDEKLAKVISRIKIYARAEPRHKIRIISAWQKKGKTVAMVGDGVNDAPAIKKADIGLAHDSGTEIAKEAADMVLLNDSFNAIVKAVEEGRIILDNLRKSVSYMLADTLTSIIVVGGSKIVFGWPLPILPAQLLWNNIVEDTFPALAYAFEPKEKGIMKRKPLSPKSSFFTKEMKILILFTGLIDEFLILYFFWFVWTKLGYDLEHARTLVFGAICLDTAFVAYSYKNLKKNVWKINLFSNRWLNFSVFLVGASFLAAIYSPFLQKILKTTPLNLLDWGMIVLICIASVFFIEMTKWIFIRSRVFKE
ncbi:MAG: HAD-IC family P-type ATPase [Patescibacteria group bacterium]|nr:HAD-IC family P-type ATPase [Patescibacteria group bacterium]